MFPFWPHLSVDVCTKNMLLEAASIFQLSVTDNMATCLKLK